MLIIKVKFGKPLIMLMLMSTGNKICGTEVKLLGAFFFF